MALIGVLACLLLALAGCGNAGKYDRAVKDISEGRYDAAIKAFTELGEYEDSSKYLVYAEALKRLKEGQHEAAKQDFLNLGDFKSSMLYAEYSEAADLRESGWYETAYETFLSLGSFSDSAVQAENTLREWAEYSEEIDDYDTAQYAWRKIDEQNGSHELESSMLLRYAELSEKAGTMSDLRESRRAYQQLEELKDEENLANKHFFELGERAYTQGKDPEQAAAILLELTSGYKPADELLAKIAEHHVTAGDYEKAIDISEFGSERC